MSDFDLKSAIDAAKEQDVLSFKDIIQSAIEDKVSDNLELKKMELAGSLFGQQDSEEETPELDASMDLEFEDEVEVEFVDAEEESPEETSDEVELGDLEEK